jgi:hypothetical protein
MCLHSAERQPSRGHVSASAGICVLAVLNKFYVAMCFTICFTICLFISPDLDGNFRSLVKSRCVSRYRYVCISCVFRTPPSWHVFSAASRMLGYACELEHTVCVCVCQVTICFTICSRYVHDLFVHDMFKSSRVYYAYNTILFLDCLWRVNRNHHH